MMIIFSGVKTEGMFRGKIPESVIVIQLTDELFYEKKVKKIEKYF